MSKIARIGIDTSKGSFELHGVNEKDEVVLRRTVRRRQFLEFMAKLEPTVIGLEACGRRIIGRASLVGWAIG